MHRKLPTLKQLRYLVTLDQTRHFGKAAERNFVSQSAFSVGIKELETLLETQLVDRTHKSVALTDEGRQFAARARGVIEEVEAMVDAVRGQGEPLTGSLKLGVIPTIAPFLLAPLMPALASQYPRLKLFIREEQTRRILAELLSGELDLLLLALPWDLGHVETRVLFSDPFVLAYHRDSRHFEGEAFAPESLQPQSVLLLEDGHCLRDHALAACELDSPSTINDFKVSSLQTLVQMVNEDLGLTFLPRMALTSGLLKGTGIATLPMPGHASRDIGLAWRQGSARAREFQLFGEVVQVIHARLIES